MQNKKGIKQVSDAADTVLTSPKRGIKLGADWIACASVADRQLFLNDLTKGELLALPFLFDFWAMEHQLPSAGDWRSWVIMGGRGAGKTRAGAEWVRSQVEGPRPADCGSARCVALVGETLDQAREVMVFGDSGILACSPPDRRPRWHASRKRLIWPNGAVAQIFSARDPESLRGPQFDAAWADELAKWKSGRNAWDMLQFALRLGAMPRQCVTTTPRNVGVLKGLLKHPSTVRTHAATEANRANLAESFLAEVKIRYAGTRLGRQELDGILLEEAEGALWTSAQLSCCQIDTFPELDRIVVALDPPVSGHAKSDECGIIVAGACTQGPVQNWRGYILADYSLAAASPSAWSLAAIKAMDVWGGERLIAEVNQGGDMVESVIRQIDPLVAIKKVHASRGKSVRAEPVAALYEQGRIKHLRGLDGLEAQMCQMTAQGFEGKGSPDRVDALVWAVHDLLVAPAVMRRQPQIRLL